MAMRRGELGEDKYDPDLSALAEVGEHRMTLTSHIHVSGWRQRVVKIKQTDPAGARRSIV
eukprot:473586-Amphidinium_carterae.1